MIDIETGFSPIERERPTGVLVKQLFQLKNGLDIKKLRFSYKRLNQDVDGKVK